MHRIFGTAGGVGARHVNGTTVDICSGNVCWVWGIEVVCRSSCCPTLLVQRWWYCLVSQDTQGHRPVLRRAVLRCFNNDYVSNARLLGRIVFFWYIYRASGESRLNLERGLYIYGVVVGGGVRVMEMRHAR